MDPDLLDYYEDREDQTRQLAEQQIEQQEAIDDEEENEDPTRICWYQTITSVDQFNTIGPTSLLTKEDAKL